MFIVLPLVKFYSFSDESPSLCVCVCEQYNKYVTQVVIWFVGEIAQLSTKYDC